MIVAGKHPVQIGIWQTVVNRMPICTKALGHITVTLQSHTLRKIKEVMYWTMEVTKQLLDAVYRIQGPIGSKQLC